MKKLYGVVTLTVGLTSATLLSKTTTRVEAAAAQAGIKNVVLVLGAFADGSGWEASRRFWRRISRCRRNPEISETQNS